jgi:hypothetical protein
MFLKHNMQLVKKCTSLEWDREEEAGQAGGRQHHLIPLLQTPDFSPDWGVDCQLPTFSIPPSHT